VILHKKVGDHVEQGTPLCTLLVNDEVHLDQATALIAEAYAIADAPATALSLVLDRLSGPPPRLAERIL
jgi:thymidine phosphorylase